MFCCVTTAYDKLTSLQFIVTPFARSRSFSRSVQCAWISCYAPSFDSQSSAVHLQTEFIELKKSFVGKLQSTVSGVSLLFRAIHPVIGSTAEEKATTEPTLTNLIHRVKVYIRKT